MVDFDFINPVINYNRVRVARIDDHLLAAHNLLGYTLIDRDWIAKRPNQPDWVGLSKRPNKLEEVEGEALSSTSAGYSF